LARWAEAQPVRWRSADGDLLLTPVVDFPCPSDELAPANRRVGKGLLVGDKGPGSAAPGERIGAEKLAGLPDVGVRKRRMIFRLCRAGVDVEWLPENEAMFAR